MASNRKLDGELREFYLQKIMEFFTNSGEEVLRTNSNECVFPCTDADKNDKWVQIVVKVPTGGRDGEPFDGYSVSEDYSLKLKLKEENKKIAEEKKQKKIAKDKAKREKQD